MSPTPKRDPNAPPDPNELREIPDQQHPAGQDVNPHNPVPQPPPAATVPPKPEVPPVVDQTPPKPSLPPSKAKDEDEDDDGKKPAVKKK